MIQESKLWYHYIIIVGSGNADEMSAWLSSCAQLYAALVAKGGTTPLHASIMHTGYHGNILVGKKQENCRSLSLLYVTMVTCMHHACMQRCISLSLS